MPAHFRPRLLLLVALGGAIGTAIREGLSLALPNEAGTFPFTVFTINLVGSFALGMLLETLLLRGPDEGRARGVRVFVGTGILGGFTTYSSFAVATAQLAGAQAGIGVLYALVSVVGGFALALLGIVAARRLRGQDARAAAPVGATSPAAPPAPQRTASKAVGVARAGSAAAGSASAGSASTGSTSAGSAAAGSAAGGSAAAGSSRAPRGPSSRPSNAHRLKKKRLKRKKRGGRR